MQIPLGRGAFERQPGKLPQVRLVNRVFEETPADVETFATLISRPGTRRYQNVGPGPIRQTFTRPGVGDGALFVVSGTSFYRVDTDDTVTQIFGTVADTATEPDIEGTQDYVYIVDGQSLLFYDPNGGRATATWTLTANLVNGDTVTIGSQVYTFVDTLSTAYDVLIGSDPEETLQNFADAVNAQPETIGISYGLGTQASDDCRADEPREVTGPEWKVTLTALEAGPNGNTITTTDSSLNAFFTDGTFTGGQVSGLNAIQTPDDRIFVSLAVLEGYVLLLEANSQRIFFIRPVTVGEPIPRIQALDFFSAESIPDEGVSLRTVGDLMWCFGQGSTEAFYFSGTGDIPFARFQGRSFSKGILPGTDATIDNTVILVGEDKVVYAITPGGQKRISNHGIEELIRLSVEREKANS